MAEARRAGHARWVRICHAVAAVSLVVLAFTGIEILMVHPRLYWGHVGNDLTPALLELPISRNYRHGGWEASTAFFADRPELVSARRTFEIFNENGWGRSLHFFAGWWLVVSGAIYLGLGLLGGHFRRHLLPARSALTWANARRELLAHLRWQIPAASGGPDYGLLQRCSYLAVVWFALPLVVVTGLTMSPAVAAAFPFVLDLFGGHQSARTIHFGAFAALLLFSATHLTMVIASGFRRQLRAITIGRPS
jgi:thiosulfate reductase cytochrome b subunit